jgi:DNA-binding NtrC family response regulator
MEPNESGTANPDSRGLRMRGAEIAIVEDDGTQRTFLETLLGHEGFVVRSYGSAGELLHDLPERLPSIFLLDLHLPGMSGLELLDRIRTRYPHTPVVLLTSDGEVGTVVDAMRRGAYDYLTKPVAPPHLLATLRHALEASRLSRQLRALERERSGGGYGGLVGRSTAMRQVFGELDRVAPTEVTVLIQGESGTGKELAARALHAQSGRASGAFVAVNCAAIPEGLLESELFGHERGAFTGAIRARAGLFERAHGGTLFLDELGDLPLALQGRLLRVLQERTIVRVGGVEEIDTDFRLVCATHRDLEGLVARGGFREDLFFRVAVFELRLPPLRERREDIAGLVDYFVRTSSAGGREGGKGVTPEALEALLHHDWPGNVRELENAVTRALVTAGDRIEVRDLPPRIVDGRTGGSAASPMELSGSGVGPGRTRALPAPGASNPRGPEPDRGELNLRALEEDAIRRALETTGGNLTEAARLLGIGRTTLYRRLELYGIPRSA